MDYLTFLKTYDYPELVALDIVLQKADLFGDDYRMTYFSEPKQFCFVTFRDGIKFLGLKGRYILLVVKEKNQIDEYKTFIKKLVFSYDRNEQIAFLVLSENCHLLSSNNGYTILGFKTIEKEIDNYISLHYDSLLSNCKKSKEDIVKKNDGNGDFDSPIDVSEDVLQTSANSISKNNIDKYSSFYRDSNCKCAFILGNGVSIPFGADPWEKLINNLIDYLSPFYIQNADCIVKELSKSNYLISSFVRTTFEEKGLSDVYNAGLKYCIYRKFSEKMFEENSLLKAIALAKINNPNLAILTYNYDEFLEKQIKMCCNSFAINSFSGDDYQKHIKNSVIHLHGTIKKDSTQIDENLVLTDKEYFRAYLRGNNSWVFKAQFNTLCKYKCLYIGSSMSDLFQLSIIENVQSKMGKDWQCFALMCFKNLQDNEKNNLVSFYKKKGISIIFVDDYKELMDTLNDITGLSFSNAEPSYFKE